MTIECGVVLAAGEGTRVRPLTQNRPKPMLPAANRPILEHVLDTLVETGVSELVVVVGYRRNRVQEHFGHTYRDVPITYVVQEKQLGSGHALLEAREEVDGPMLVVNGDRVIAEEMVESVIDRYETTGDPTLAVLEHPEAHTYGAVRLDGDRVVELVEKPAAGVFGLINAGIYAFGPEMFDTIAETPREAGELGLTEGLVQRIENEETVRGVLTDGLWVDATYPWDLLELSREVLREGRVEETERHPDTYVSKTARVHERATLQAPVVVGPDCEVAAGAVVGPNTALGRNVTVGANATVVGSVLDADTRVGAGSTLVETVTGQDVHLGASTVVPGGPADVVLDAEVFRAQDLGAVFADRVRAEGAVTGEPGTMVGPGATLRTGVVVRGRIEADAEVVR